MKGSRVKELVNGWADEQEIFCAFYDKDEADEYIANNLMEDEEISLTDEEWLSVLHRMETDEGLWEEMNNAWQYAINRVIEKRKGNNGNNQ